MTNRIAYFSRTLAPLCAGVCSLLLCAATPGCADGSAPLGDGSSAAPDATTRSSGSSRRGVRTPMYPVQSTIESAAPTHAGIRVETDNGAVEIDAGGGDSVRVHATMLGATPDRARNAQAFAAPNAEGDLRVGVIWPGAREAAEGASFRVEAPGSARLLGVRTSAGPVRVNGMRGDATIRTTRGEIVVNDFDGPVDVETTLAQIMVRNAAGPVVARTTHGLVTIHGAASSVHCVSYNAGVDVRLTPDNPGPVIVETTLGAVSIDIGPAFVGEIELHADRGSLQIDAAFNEHVVSRSRDRATLRFGESGRRSVVTTTGATIRLRPVK